MKQLLMAALPASVWKMRFCAWTATIQPNRACGAGPPGEHANIRIRIHCRDAIAEAAACNNVATKAIQPRRIASGCTEAVILVCTNHASKFRVTVP